MNRVYILMQMLFLVVCVIVIVVVSMVVSMVDVVVIVVVMVVVMITLMSSYYCVYCLHLVCICKDTGSKAKCYGSTVYEHMNRIAHQTETVRVNPVSHLNDHEPEIQT